MIGEFGRLRRGRARRWALPRALCYVALGLLSGPGTARAQDAADRAWARGETETAWRLYSGRLAADSNDVRALHRVGLMAAWEGRHELSLGLFDRLLRVDPDNVEAAVDRARVRAWQGHPAAAAQDLDRVLARRPGYLPALQARAQFLSWAGEFGPALSTYEQLATILPEDRDVRSARAQVLSWAERLDESIALYDSLVRTDLADRAARRALAQVLGWAGRLDSAAAVYRRLIADDATDVEAWTGLARTKSWGGRLKAAEADWRRAVAVDSTHVPAWAGLAQTLRWQGRDAAALEAAEQAGPGGVNDPELRTQRRWIEAAMRPRAGVSYTYESDSDGNGIGTVSLRAAWRPVPPIELRAHGYYRAVSLDVPASLEREARGGLLEVWTQLEPGWGLSAGLGASGSDATTGGTVTRYALRATSPGREIMVISGSLTRDALDATAPLVENGVTIRQLGLDYRASPPGPWSFTGAFSIAEFDGVESNTRVAGAASGTRRIGRGFAVGLAARTFGFEQDLAEGYFDPDFYGILEAPVRWRREFDHVAPSLEVAPGLQKVGSGGDLGATIRLTGELRLTVAPGRELAVGLGYSTLGMALFAADVGDYKYRWVTLSGGWAF